MRATPYDDHHSRKEGATTCKHPCNRSSQRAPNAPNTFRERVPRYWCKDALLYAVVVSSTDALPPATVNSHDPVCTPPLSKKQARILRALAWAWAARTISATLMETPADETSTVCLQCSACMHEKKRENERQKCKKFVTRESNPGQVDGNDLCYHYTSDEWTDE